MTIKDEILVKLLEVENIISYEPVKLASGEISYYYIKVKKSFGHPEILKLYVKYILEFMGNDINRFTCVASSGYGGVPLATAISICSGLKLTMIRDEEKDHGEKNLFDGFEELDSNDFVLVVDDVLTSGGSIKKIMPILEKTGAKIGRIIVIVRRKEGPEPIINGMKVNCIFTAEELMEAMKK